MPVTRRFLLFLLAVLTISIGPARTASADNDFCRQDSKLIGRIELSTADGPDTWWGLTRQGLLAAGIQEEDFLATFGTWFGQTFSSLDEVIALLVDAVRPFDKNGNNYVCASSVRGTRTVVGDPNYAFYYFRVVDDKENAED